ncbi:hypothetical protein ACFV9C_20740 [Kribbella sp. NPDC059898]|uniref:hypothetical protein n=1 Tax=Kribbella sp. NPDC059898 TaxID=3346995 RepID=UPI0036671BDA
MMDEMLRGPDDADEPAPTPEDVARALIATFNEVPMDFTGSADAWRYGGGRDLSRLAERARESAD